MFQSMHPTFQPNTPISQNVKHIKTNVGREWMLTQRSSLFLQGYEKADYPKTELENYVECQKHWSQWQTTLPAKYTFIPTAASVSNSKHAGSICAHMCTKETVYTHQQHTGNEQCFLFQNLKNICFFG